MSDTPKQPTVSVVLPTYNHSPFLPKALEAMASQAMQDYELFVVDDGSEDNFDSAIADSPLAECGLRQTIIRHPHNKGTAEAINSGIAEAKGRYWTWISADNVMSPLWLHRMVETADSGDIAVVYSSFTRFNDGNFKGIKRHPYRKEKLISTSNSFFGPSFLIWAPVWEAVGPHRGKAGHDYDHWTRVEEEVWRRGMQIVHLDEPLCDYHVGPWSTGRAHPELRDATEWQKEAQRRRAESGVCP